MHNLQKLMYETKSVNVLVDATTRETLFDASNVCEALGYIGTASDVLRRLNLDEKVLVTKDEQKGYAAGAYPLQNPQDKWFVTESGLYSLIFGSEKPEAKAFKKWVTSVVLPAIRKTGSYCALTPKQLANIRSARILIMGKKTYYEKTIEEYIQTLHQTNRQGMTLSAEEITAGVTIKQLYSDMNCGDVPFKLFAMRITEAAPKVVLVGRAVLCFFKGYAPGNLSVK